MGVGFTGKTEIKGIGMTGRRVSIYWIKRNLGGKWPVEEYGVWESIERPKIDGLNCNHFYSGQYKL